jgi:hypothetical protein
MCVKEMNEFLQTNAESIGVNHKDINENHRYQNSL